MGIHSDAICNMKCICILSNMENGSLKGQRSTCLKFDIDELAIKFLAGTAGGSFKLPPAVPRGFDPHVFMGGGPSGMQQMQGGGAMGGHMQVEHSRNSVFL